MEKGYFQPSSPTDPMGFLESPQSDSVDADMFEKHDLEFQSAENIPLPNQVPKSPNVPLETLKSSTVQTLISQNEDLSARLNVALRRLMLLENENENLKRGNQGFQAQFAAFSDQIMIWKEKEKLVRQKSESLESELYEMKSRFPEFERMQEIIERYRKYHEKVKTQVKPFIQGLKSYSENLAGEIRVLNEEVEHKENRIHDLEIEMAEQRQSLEIRLRSELEKQVMIVQGYEKSRDQLIEKIRAQEAALSKAEIELQDLARLKIREDELENMAIALGREKEELHRSLNGELTELRVQWKEALKIAEEKREENAELKQRTLKLEKLNSSLALEIEDLQIQLDSQRRLWSQQCSTIEQLKSSKEALERINKELSQQLRASKD